MSIEGPKLTSDTPSQRNVDYHTYLPKGPAGYVEGRKTGRFPAGPRASFVDRLVDPFEQPAEGIGPTADRPPVGQIRPTFTETHEQPPENQSLRVIQLDFQMPGHMGEPRLPTQRQFDDDGVNRRVPLGLWFPGFLVPSIP